MNKPNPYDFSDPLHWLARCDVCGWPLADDRSNGCAEFDCSMRPQPAGYGLNHAERLAARAEIRRLETALRNASTEVKAAFIAGYGEGVQDTKRCFPSSPVRAYEKWRRGRVSGSPGTKGGKNT